MKSSFRRILHGGDYNPNQWPKDVWQEDMRMFKAAGINSATINVFSWAKIQPSEERYDFTQLDEIIEMLSGEQHDIVLATSTAALPAWLVKRYPEVARTDFNGCHHKFGRRHNACPNSPIYQHFARLLVEKLAERYAGNEHIVCWHINNEYGGTCYCENCEKAFRVWLRKKYGTLQVLNKAWNTEFWGHTIYDWDEIVLPNALSEEMEPSTTAFAGISIDYYRFNSDSMLENFKMEREAIRAFDSSTPITTNFMGTYKQLDYFKWAKEMDIVSWDNYPSYDTPWSLTAMRHDLMRGLKSKPFMLMEQTPSQQNWQPYNSLKKPGQMRAQSYQTLAHGADTIQYFQLRRSVGACEKFHGAVIAHAGTEKTRVFREVKQLGKELAILSPMLPGADYPAQIGVIFDWENYWALEYTSGPNKDLKYVEQIHQYYRHFYDRNIPVDMIPVDANFSRYQIVVAPVLYMVKEGVAEALEQYVKTGGILITSFMSGLVDQSDNVHLGGYPGPLRKLAGVWVEEIDALAPEQTNTVSFEDGTETSCRLLCDLMHLETAKSVARYTSNFYAGMPVVTRNCFGEGITYYVGTEMASEGLAKVIDMAITEANISSVVDIATRLEITCRDTETERLYFVINFEEEKQILPSIFVGCENTLTGELLNRETMLAQFDVCLFRIKK